MQFYLETEVILLLNLNIYLPIDNSVKDGYIVYTSGIDGKIPAAIPVGKVFIKKDKKLVKFFVDFNQIDFVKVNR